jgi:hypothetical protein
VIYGSAQGWLDAPHRRVVLFGMSGLGKTHASRTLRHAGWFHYSVDYRIGTRHMGELIADNAKREAMKVPFLRDLLLSDSIYIGANVSFDNLDPVSTYLGKPGDPARGGLPFASTRGGRPSSARRGRGAPRHGRFIDRALALYGYPHFVCDTGGSICEWVDPEDPDDPVLSSLSTRALLVWIEGTPPTRPSSCAASTARPSPWPTTRPSSKRPGRVPDRAGGGRGGRGPRRLHPLGLRAGARAPRAALPRHGAARRDGHRGLPCRASPPRPTSSK